jgi:hypothetical protein
MSQPVTTIVANGDYDIGGGAEMVTSVVFQVTGTFSVSLTPKARVVGNAQAAAINLEYVNLATGTPVAAGTAITTTGLFAVKAGGLTISLTAGSFVSGAAVVRRMEVLGVVQ